ncbi:hypothetical protein ILUMI_13109 [Ignelater luminosus]|uniref:Ku domain-containing protein n=1 Tax=Ignelater luminosus TaxID=2038154 RepID=A0A8K0CSV9_IGNLU|nr:hypothetical protein ILUMI_13109 [Ignelater luminosus]
MPPAAKRNASVILFDVNTSEEFAEAARKCLLNICASKWFMESKDVTKLMLLNTAQTRNKINAKFDGKCPHVYTATDVIVSYNPNEVRPHIEGDIAKAEADWLMGLAAAIEELKDEFLESKGVMTLQLLFITDLSTPVAEKEKRITFVIDNLNKMKVFLYILGPEVKIPHCMATFEDIKKWTKNIEFIASEEENANLRIAKRIIEHTNGIICDLKVGQELFKCYSNRWGLQAWKVPLTIGSSFTSSAAMTRFIRSSTGPKFKSSSSGTWEWHLVDDVSETVGYDNVIGGVFRHEKFVPLPEDVKKNFKYFGERCFKIIGFTDKRNISELYLQDNGSQYVESNGSNNFRLLVHVLNNQNKCIVAKQVYNRNCKPRILVLLPDAEKEILISAELPYADNMKVNFTEQNLEEAPELDKSNPAVDAMYEYLQKLDITDSNNLDENGSVKVPLAASLMDSIKLNVVAQRCLQKYLGNEINFEETNIEVPQLVNDTSDYSQYLPVRPKKEKDRTDD